MPDRDLQSEVRDPAKRAALLKEATRTARNNVSAHPAARGYAKLFIAALVEIDRLSGICTAILEAAAQATSEERFGELVTEKVLPLLAESKP